MGLLHPGEGRGLLENHRLQFAVVAQLVEQLHGGPQAPPTTGETRSRIPNYG
jgi:hypothetical protein